MIFYCISPGQSASVDKAPFSHDNTRVQNLPALIIGLIMAIYWARVLRLAWKEKRRTGQAANLLPPETLGRVLRLIWFPTIGLWIVLPILAGSNAVRALLRFSAFRPLYTIPIVAWAMLTIAIAAFIATLICWKKMGRSWRMGINPNDKTQLIVSGPYAYLRHPIYALSSLLMLCTMAILPTPAMLVVGVLHLSLLQWEARREEKYLTALHGASYSDYAMQTGRFLPKF
jgi:protein-S-isoprenylcysteine O-methyltransferase Ste14